MAILLKSEILDDIFEQLQKTNGDSKSIGALVQSITPIINLTAERFPRHLTEDLKQELKVFIMSKAKYFAEAYFAGKIRNPTNYFFRVFRNAAIAYMKKDAREGYQSMVPLDDVKSEMVYTIGLSKKDVIEKIRIQLLDWIRLRFTLASYRRKAEQFIGPFFTGTRPSMSTNSIEKFSQMNYKYGKEVYSVVLTKLRELVVLHYEELLD